MPKGEISPVVHFTRMCGVEEGKVCTSRVIRTSNLAEGENNRFVV